jgi:hypothetical protein
MEIDAWHHWVWLRPLFILLLLGMFVALAAVIGWFKRRWEKRARRTRMARVGHDRREVRVVGRDSADALKSRWRGPTATAGTESRPPLRRVAGSLH